jgi:hypothetical protein
MHENKSEIVYPSQQAVTDFCLHYTYPGLEVHMANAFPNITRFISQVGVHVFDIKAVRVSWRKMMSLAVESETGKHHQPTLTPFQKEADETAERKSEHERTKGR